MWLMGIYLHQGNMNCELKWFVHDALINTMKGQIYPRKPGIEVGIHPQKGVQAIPHKLLHTLV